MTVRVLINPVTGYYASYSHGTMVHVKEAGTHRPLCGANVDALQFQWCAMRVAPEYIECLTCRRILGLSRKPQAERWEQNNERLVRRDGSAVGQLRPGTKVHRLGAHT